MLKENHFFKAVPIIYILTHRLSLGKIDISIQNDGTIEIVTARGKWKLPSDRLISQKGKLSLKFEIFTSSIILSLLKDSRLQDQGIR